MTTPSPRRDQAETLAIEALQFLAADPEQLARFLALTGLEAQDLRLAAAEPGFFAGVLRFMMEDERILLRFCEEAGVRPASVSEAMRALPLGNDQDHQRSI